MGAQRASLSNDLSHGIDLTQVPTRLVFRKRLRTYRLALPESDGYPVLTDRPAIQTQSDRKAEGSTNRVNRVNRGELWSVCQAISDSRNIRIPLVSAQLTWMALDEAGEVGTAANRPAFPPQTPAPSRQTFCWPLNLPRKRYDSRKPVPKKEIPILTCSEWIERIFDAKQVVGSIAHVRST
jgi:hypothetical protein